MANVVKESVTPTLIENTTMLLGYVNGVARSYEIAPNEGYVLHDKNRDWYEVDPDTGEEVSEPTLGYTAGMTSCPASYNFVANPREFYAVPEDSVPADQIFGGGNNNHEIM